MSSFSLCFIPMVAVFIKGQCVSLSLLDVRACKKLESLPATIGNLKNLRCLVRSLSLWGLLPCTCSACASVRRRPPKTPLAVRDPPHPKQNILISLLLAALNCSPPRREKGCVGVQGAEGAAGQFGRAAASRTNRRRRTEIPSDCDGRIVRLPSSVRLDETIHTVAEPLNAARCPVPHTSVSAFINF